MILEGDKTIPTSPTLTGSIDCGSNHGNVSNFRVHQLHNRFVFFGHLSTSVKTEGILL